MSESKVDPLIPVLEQRCATFQSIISRLEREKELLHAEVERIKQSWIVLVKDDPEIRDIKIGCGSISVEHYESLKADAERWRNMLFCSPESREVVERNEDAKKWREAVSRAQTKSTVIEGEAEDMIADSLLGALVRKMPISRKLVHTDWEHLNGKWAVTKFYRETLDEGWFDTPEEALRAAGIE